MVLQRPKVVVLVMMVVVGSVIGIDLIRTPTYAASVQILVGQEQGSENLSAEVQGLSGITKTVEKAVITWPVAEATVQQLNLQTSPEALLSNLKATQVEETQFIEIRYEDTDPERAQQIVNTVGEVFSNQVSDVSSRANAVTATVWEPAVQPGSPTSPQILRDAVLALMLGGILGIGLVFLLEQLDVRWRSPEEVERTTGVPVFGLIPKFEISKVSKSEKRG